MTKHFDELEIRASLIAALEKQNITIPTEIQEKVIPEALKNKDLIVESETGTGKTLAYLLPLFEKLDGSKREMQAIILVPTHELAMQILRVIERLAQDSEEKMNALSLIGNVNIERQIEKLREKPHILVGSPGRMLELIKRKKISAHTIRTIILDEGDKLLDDSNLENVKAVIKSTLKERQLMLFSASVPRETEVRARELMKESGIIRGGQKLSVPATLTHWSFLAEKRDKIEVLRKLAHIVNPEKALVFVGEREETDIFAGKLRFHGLKAASLHGYRDKVDRKRILEAFRTGELQLLLASDIAARGLDIEGITHVFNIDIPEQPRDYLHRVGRAGRNGNEGVAISIITAEELPRLRMYEKTLKISIAPKAMYQGTLTDVRPGGKRGKAPEKREET